MMTNVFIDGSAGTTGLRIYDRLKARDDISLVTLPEEIRKDANARKDAMNNADIVFLCLPDDAAREAVTFMENPDTVVIDTSTAHRTAEGWTYGFPELDGQFEKIRTAKRIANPGCHASGFISLIAPLTENGILAADTALSCYSLTGYSGGGKKMIASYEADCRSVALDSPRIYGLTLQHKHLPEMQKITGLKNPPVFCPVVSDYYKGMATTIMLPSSLLQGAPSAKDIWDVLNAHYANQPLVHVAPFQGEGFLHDNMIDANHMAGSNALEILVCGKEDQTIVTALFDNLGKGASGAAVQNMNLMLGLPETTGLLED